MRRHLANFAYDMAKETMARAEEARWLRDFIRLRGQSRWWSDVECWLSGLGSWRDLRSARRRAHHARSQRRQLPFADFAVEGPH